MTTRMPAELDRSRHVRTSEQSATRGRRTPEPADNFLLLQRRAGNGTVNRWLDAASTHRPLGSHPEPTPLAPVAARRPHVPNERRSRADAALVPPIAPRLWTPTDRIMRSDVDPTTVTKGCVFWAPIGGIYRLATVVGAPTDAHVEVNFGDETKHVSVSDLYEQNSAELEDVGDGRTRRVIRKGFGGTSWGDIANVLGLTGAGAGAAVATSHEAPLLQTGIAGGAMVILGGISQIARACVLASEDTWTRAIDAAKGVLNLAAGSLAVASGATGLAGDTVSAALGISSGAAWMLVEAVNVVDQWKGAIADVKAKKLSGRVASVVASCLKILGGGVLIGATALASEPALIAGMTIGGAGALLGLIAGVAKLVQVWFGERRRAGAMEEGPGGDVDMLAVSLGSGTMRPRRDGADVLGPSSDSDVLEL